MNQEIQKIIEIMLKDAKVRRSVARENHLMFFGAYFGHYIELEFAPFHHEIFALSEAEQIKTLVVTAARGTGKSTILNMSLAIWAILGKLNKKFVVILSHTQTKARQHYTNLKKELEDNKLLKADLGPFKEDHGEWSSSLVLPYYNARITFASTEQSIRGMRHKQYRPDLIIADDLEDNDSVKTLDGRNKTHDWLTKDIIPAGDANTKLVVVGTLLHEDSVMMRLKKEILEGTRAGEYREYPLLNETGKVLWPAKYPNQASLDTERLRVGDDRAWHQEYLLKILSRTDQVVFPEWIQHYNTIPEKTRENDYRGAYTAIDLAISERERADYTAMVSAYVFGYREDLRIYILPYPVNERLDFPKVRERAKQISAMLGEEQNTKLYVEDVQYQRALVQALKQEGYPAEGISIVGDKTARLTLVTPLLESGKVFFPRKGCEKLIQQLTGFRVERYDDLADAFSLLLGALSKMSQGGMSAKDRERYAEMVAEIPRTHTAELFRELDSSGPFSLDDF